MSTVRQFVVFHRVLGSSANSFGWLGFKASFNSLEEALAFRPKYWNRHESDLQVVDLFTGEFYLLTFEEEWEKFTPLYDAAEENPNAKKAGNATP